MREDARTHKRAGRWAAVTLVSSVVILVALPVAWAVTRPKSNVGAVPTEREANPDRASPDRRGSIATERSPEIAVHSGRLADRRSPSPSPMPLRVRIDAIGLNAPVVAVGVDEGTGGVQIPFDVRSLGWFRFGPSPGEAGSAVIVGHVDSAAQGPGALFRLREVQVGAIVVVEFAHRSASFRVVGRREYSKSRLPHGLFATSGTPVLAIVTCGGSFDSTSRHYADNIVVYAVPIITGKK
jgi:sortase (surface protein transpeptidase)